MSINNQLNLYISSVKTLLVDFKQYFDKLSEYVIKFDKEVYNTIEAELNKISIGVTSLTKQHTTLQDYISTFDKIDKINVSAEVLNTVVINDKYIKYVVHNMSQTFSIGIYHERSRLINLIDKLTKTDFTQLYTQVGKYLKLDTRANEIYKFLMQGGIGGNSFVIYIIETILDLLSEPEQRNILNLVEQYKSAILDAPKIMPPKIEYSPTQMLLLRRGLYPTSKSMAPEELCKMLSAATNKKIIWNKSISSIQNFTGISNIIVGLDINSTDTLTLLVIYHKVNFPIEYNILPLIDEDYITENNLIIDYESGVSKKVIRKYDTIYQLDSSNSQYKPGIVLFLRGKVLVAPVTNNIDIPRDTTFVIETFNDSKFRLLRSDLFGMHTDQIVTAMINLPSTRNYAYNDILSKIIVDNSKIQNHDILMKDYENEIRTAQSSAAIKDSLKKKFMIYFKESVTNINSEHGFNLACESQQMISTVINEVLSKHLLNNIDLYDEYYITFIHKLDSIITKFSREMLWYVSNIKLPQLLFKEKTREELNNYLSGVFGDIIENIIESMDNEQAVWKNIDLSFKEFVLEKKYLI